MIKTFNFLYKFSQLNLPKSYKALGLSNYRYNINFTIKLYSIMDKNADDKKYKTCDEKHDKSEKHGDSKHANFQNVLKNAEEGKVVTRFPPEPSGYLHIGHVKAAMLNFHYAKLYKGQMILRFDDTNSKKEKMEYMESIIEDLKSLEIFPDKMTHTSDYFDQLLEIMTQCLKDDKAYCDNIPQEEVKLHIQI